MLPELNNLDVKSLTPEKIEIILKSYAYKDKDETPEKKIKYILVFSYINAVLAAENAGADNNKKDTKKNMLDLTVEQIRNLVKDKEPSFFNAYAEYPEYAELKKLIMQYDAAKSSPLINQINQNVFLWVFELIKLIYKIKDPDRQAAMKTLSIVLNSLHAAYKEFRSVEEFMSLLTQLWGVHLDVKANDKAEQLAQGKVQTALEEVENAKKAAAQAIEKLQAAEEKLKQEKENALKEQQRNALNQVVESDKKHNGSSVISFRTTRTVNSTRFKQNLPQTNPIEEGNRMRAIAAWTETTVTILGYLRPAYQLAFDKEGTGELTLVPDIGSVNAKQVKSSVVYFSLIEALVNETKTPEEVLTILTKQYGTQHVTRQMKLTINLPWFVNRKDMPKLAGFIVSNEANPQTIKDMYQKLAMLANMWGDPDDSSILPQHLENSDDYIYKALEMEKQYSKIIEKIKEGRLGIRRKELAKLFEDSDKMINIGAWTEANVKLLTYLRHAYLVQVQKEALGDVVRVPENEVINSTVTNFVGKQVTLSEKYLSFIESLAEEKKTPQEIFKILTEHYPKHRVTAQLCSLKHLPWHENIAASSQFPGVALGEVAPEQEIKARYQKIAMLANMWGDEENNSILPKNIEKSDSYIEKALELEKKYAYIDVIKEGRIAVRRKEIAEIMKQKIN